MARLGDIATYINGYAFKPTDWSSEGIPIIRIQDLTGNSYQVNRFNGDYDAKYEVNYGDVLISWSASIGVYVWTDEKAVLNQHIFKVQFDKVEVDKNFFVHQVECILNNALGEAHGATMKHLTKPVFDALPFYLPNIEEQKKIANKLNKVSKLIFLRKQQISKLDELLKSRFIELFGNPLDGTAKYSLHQVGEVAEAVDPQPSHRTPPIEEGGIPYVSIKDCNHKTGKIDFDGARKVSRTVLAEHLSRYTLQDGDFVIGKIGTIGNPVFVPARNDYTLSANVVLVQPNSELVSPWFLKYSFESEFVEQQFAEAKNSTSQAAFGIQKVRSIEIMNPDLDTQRRFESFVKQTDKSKLAVQKSLEQLEILKKSLMQQYFG